MSDLSVGFSRFARTNAVKKVLQVAGDGGPHATGLSRFGAGLFVPAQVSTEESPPRENHVTFSPIESVSTVDAVHTIGREETVLVNQHPAVGELERDVHIVGEFSVARRFHIAAVSCDPYRMFGHTQPPRRHVQIMSAVVAKVTVAVFTEQPP